MKLQVIKQMPSSYDTSQACRYLSLDFDAPIELASAMYNINPDTPHHRFNQHQSFVSLMPYSAPL